MASAWNKLRSLIEADSFGDRWRARIAKNKQEPEDDSIAGRFGKLSPRALALRAIPKDPEVPEDPERFGKLSPRSLVDKPFRRQKTGSGRQAYRDPDVATKRGPSAAEVNSAKLWAMNAGKFTMADWRAQFPDDVGPGIGQALSRLIWRQGADSLRYPIRRIPGPSIPTASQAANRNKLKPDDTFEWHGELPSFRSGPSGGSNF